ncbi:hypothetical protein AGMMS50262_00880 [Bacteroidia bacterium]|nr:hypothetical protein AGMMS50262_00880 [Bacteroidia bacterium]
MKEALVEKTLKVIESISKMDFVKSYFLVGGTALSLQIKHRLSEDLDFMQWKQTKNDNPKIEIDKIKNALKYSRHHLKSKNLIGMLANSERFKPNIDFENLQPKYKISPKEIETFMIKHLKND